MFDHKETSPTDLVQMFNGTVVIYDGQPVFIHSVDESKNMHFYTFDNTKEKIIRHISDERWNFVPVPLGHCQVGDCSTFLYRIPLRQYRQGTCYKNIGYAAISETGDLKRESLHLLNSFYFPALAECILGKYKKFEEVIKSFDKSDKLYSTPLDRDFAINKEFEIYYRDSKVGIINEENGKALFKRGNSYLSKLFEEVNE